MRNMKRRRIARRYVRRTTGRIIRYRNPFAANSTKACLIYNTPLTINPAAGATSGAIHVFRANSLYDPDFSSGGHQPMYFDNYSAVYSKYRVNYAKITVTVVNTSVNTTIWNGTAAVNTPNYAYKLFILTDNQTNDLPSNINQVLEEGGSNVKWRYVAPSLNGKLPKLYAYCSPHKLNRCAFKEDTLQAEVTSNPIMAANFIVGGASADGSSDPPQFSCNVQIKYWCEFFDRKLLQAEQ